MAIVNNVLSTLYLFLAGTARPLGVRRAWFRESTVSNTLAGMGSENAAVPAGEGVGAGSENTAAFDVAAVCFA
jgi:hypothetical protein